MWGEYGSIITTPLHGDILWDSHDTYPGGGRQQRRAGYIRGVLPKRVEISGVNSGWVPGGGTQPWKTQGALHVHILKVKNYNSTGEPDTTPVVRPMWDAHASGKIGVAPKYGQV